MRAGGHSSGTRVAARLVRPTQELGRATLERSSTWPCSGWGLPCRVRYRTRGGRLLHLFTLTSAVKRRRFAFLWHFPRGYPHRALPGILPCGARTFLSTDNPSSDRLSRCGGGTLAPPGRVLVVETSRAPERASGLKLPSRDSNDRPRGAKAPRCGGVACAWSEPRAGAPVRAKHRAGGRFRRG